MKNSELFVDFHAHIMPRADHGSDSSAETDRQLQILKAANVDIVVATPHFYPEKHTVKEFETRIEQSLEFLKKCDLENAPKICLGAEVLVCESIQDMDGLERLCIRGTNCLLLEMPFARWTQGHIEVITDLIDKKYDVVLAHIDRYLKTQTNEITMLLDSGAKAQINMEALLSRFFSKKQLLKYIKEEKVYALGSDLHHEENKALAKSQKAIKLLGYEFINIMKKSGDLLKNAVYYN